MKYSISISLLLTITFAFSGKAQVSHGGAPLPFIQTRSSSADLYVTMPSFDVEEELRTASAEDNELRGSYRFAYKFMTEYNRSNSGESFSLPGGMKIWRLGIYSKDALSINVLFTAYELPEGAQVFLYNAEQTHILGSFTHLNNSGLGILPTAPVRGDKLIIEYHEPANAAFPGRLTVGEVNHAFRDLRGYEPGSDKSEFYCMPSPICFQNDPEYGKIARSVVLLTIDGVTSCTGVLLNNTLNDGKPYLLTASHCLNSDFSVKNPDYESVAGRIICFFNYQSPVCENVMRGTEEMSVASAGYKAVNEKNDMALLELLETPPVYYQPYYAGWSIEENSNNTPYAGVHHPYASVKRINISEDKIALKTFSIPQADFYKNAHWNVSKWTTGSTASGSSGSPLFDAANRVIGALSGGMSTCNRPVDDFYFALSKAWEPSSNSNEQLKYWLDPSKSNKTAVNGLDPWQDAPAHRLSNLYDTKQQDSIEVAVLPSPAGGNLFGSNTLGTQEYAEAYTVNEEAKLYGAYFVTPSVTNAIGNLDVEVTVYSGKDKPEVLLYSGAFKPAYTEMSVIDSSFIETEKWLNRPQESFIRFDKEITVSGAFYVGYKIKSPGDSSFVVYNLPKGKTSRNTAWYANKGQWTKASAHPLLPLNTSLFIDPVIQYTGNLSANMPQEGPPVFVFADTNSKSIHVLLPGNKKEAVFALYSMNGQLMYKTILSRTQTTIPVKNIEPGIYIINIKGDNIFYNQKVLF
ncbi:MAG: trypsin-like peptidase domain-containing protein [Tannerellaceae bacterium]|jgi:hypothetical protein|nr:trypsin-like peptidase domain-containing protein [Tannerellaceae bacterium]